MATKYAADIADALADIREDGDEIVFLVFPDTYDPLTDGSVPGTPQTFTGRAVEDQGDTDTLAPLGLIGQRRVKVIVANGFTDDNDDPAAFVPVAPVQFVWAGMLYTTRDIDDGVGPDGTPIIYIITGSV